MKRDKSILQEDMTRCYICGKPAVHIHEVFFGTANRKNSIKWGCYVGLCYEHHEGNTGAHHDQATNLKLKEDCERAFEEKYGREKFFEVFGKYWI